MVAFGGDTRWQLFMRVRQFRLLQDVVPPLTRSDALRTQFLPDLLENVAHLFLLGGALPVGTPYHAALLAALPAAGFLGVGADLPTTENAPRSECETLRARHRDDIPLK
jgi:hypothetical protein